MNEYKTRSIEKSLNSLVDKTPVIMITGPRQVGKSTLLTHLMLNSKKKINKVSLDDLILRSQAQEDPELFLRTHEPPLIIDEFQNAPNLLNYIKIIIDEKREDEMFRNGKKVGTLYYLTGSRVFETMEDVSESLAGRVGILDLYGFSNREIEKIEEKVFIPDISLIKKRVRCKKRTTKELFKHILNGNYPEVVNKNGLPREKFYETYLRTYIERDIRKLINIKNESKFIKFVTCVAARTSCEYNAQDIANDIEVDNKTIDDWMSILVNTHLVYMLSAYSNNNVQKAIKRPKMYFTDTGLACYLTGYMNEETLYKSAYSGWIFETHVINEIIKSFVNNGIDVRRKLYYYRDSGREIDLIINYDNVLYPIEIKQSANPSKSAIKNFDVTAKFEGEKGNGIVLCMINEITAIDDSNYFVPIEYI